MFIQTASGNVLYLDTLNGRIIEAATSETALLVQLEEESIREDVLMPVLAGKLAVALGKPGEGECFSVKIPLSIGGKLEPDNFEILLVAKHLSALGDLQRQVSNDPPGTRYRPLRPRDDG